MRRGYSPANWVSINVFFLKKTVTSSLVPDKNSTMGGRTCSALLYFKYHFPRV